MKIYLHKEIINLLLYHEAIVVQIFMSAVEKYISTIDN